MWNPSKNFFKYMPIFYGFNNFYISDYNHCNKFAKFDYKKLYAKFNKIFILENDLDVKVKTDTKNIKLGGYIFKLNYSAFI